MASHGAMVIVRFYLLLVHDALEEFSA